MFEREITLHGGFFPPCFLVMCVCSCTQGFSHAWPSVHMCGSHTGRMKSQRQLPKESWQGTGGARREVRTSIPPIPYPSPAGLSPVLLLGCLLQKPLRRRSSLLEKKSASNNQKEAEAGRNAEGFSGDTLEPTRGASDRQEEGSI